MRNFLFAILAAVFLASPASAASTYCSMEGPHSCGSQIENQLMNITHNMVHQIQLSQSPHPFRTQNDEVLELAARQNAMLAQPQTLKNAPAQANQQ